MKTLLLLVPSAGVLALSIALAPGYRSLEAHESATCYGGECNGQENQKKCKTGYPNCSADCDWADSGFNCYDSDSQIEATSGQVIECYDLGDPATHCEMVGQLGDQQCTFASQCICSLGFFNYRCGSQLISGTLRTKDVDYHNNCE